MNSNGFFISNSAGIVAGVLKATGFGIAATLPKKYTNAVMAGQGLSGVVMVTVGLLVEFLSKGDEGYQSLWFPSTSRIVSRTTRSGTIFFSSASLVMLFCACATAYMQSTKYYRFYQERKRRKAVWFRSPCFVDWFCSWSLLWLMFLKFLFWKFSKRSGATR